MIKQNYDVSYSHNVIIKTDDYGINKLLPINDIERNAIGISHLFQIFFSNIQQYADKVGRPLKQTEEKKANQDDLEEH